MRESQCDLTIFSVATDRYISFWSKMVNSYLATNSSNVSVQWILFTDKSEEIDTKLISQLGDSLLISNIGHREWPFPTLLRYEYLLSVADQIQGDIVMHLDADMIFVDDIDFQNIRQLLEANLLAFVSHPGYYRPAGSNKILFFLRNPKFLAKDFRTRLKYGGLGTWERNKLSTAYVPRRYRKKYFCGGTWLGQRSAIVDLCSILSTRVNEDLEKNIVATFHDESHLNWFCSNNKVINLDPEFCYDISYPQLALIRPKIIAVNKNQVTKWIR